jgi:hypothetical protein
VKAKTFIEALEKSRVESTKNLVSKVTQLTHAMKESQNEECPNNSLAHPFSTSEIVECLHS